MKNRSCDAMDATLNGTVSAGRRDAGELDRSTAEMAALAASAANLSVRLLAFVIVRAAKVFGHLACEVRSGFFIAAFGIAIGRKLQRYAIDITNEGMKA